MTPILDADSTPPAAPAKATHTPGPWRIGSHGGIVADFPIAHGVKGTDDTAYYGGYLICETVAPCNQPLIAAAPDLLAALERAEEALWPSVEGETEESCHPQIWDAYHGALAAIAKAREVAS